MREIKFRGKSSWGSPNWVYGELIQNSDGGFYIIPKEEFLADGHHLIIDSDAPHWVAPETIGQFTGIRDKNGKEIYEGDIVRWIDSDENECIDLVKWKFGGLVLCNAQYTVGSYGLIEVIGNIHDNPELIK